MGQVPIQSSTSVAFPAGTTPQYEVRPAVQYFQPQTQVSALAAGAAIGGQMADGLAGQGFLQQRDMIAQP